MKSLSKSWSLVFSYVDYVSQVPCNLSEVFSVEELFEGLKAMCASLPSSIKKEKLPAIVAGVYVNNEINKKNTEFCQVMGIDIDENNIQADQIQIPFSHIRYESPSSTENNRKWRILLPLAKPIYNHWTINYLENCKKLLPNFVVDTSCKDSSRKFFIPNSSKLSSFYMNSGQPLYDFDITLESAAKKEKPESNEPPSKMDIITASKWAEVEKCLKIAKEKKIDIAPTRDDWIILARALGSISETDVDRGVEAFYEFSQLYSQGEPPDYNTCGEKFVELMNSADGSVSINSFFDMVYKKEILKKREKAKVDNGIAYLVGVPKSNTYSFIAYENTVDDEIVRLHPEEYNIATVVAALKKDTNKQYQLKYEDISYESFDDKTQKTTIKEVPSADIIVDFRVAPLQHGFLLGQKEIGKYIDKKSNSLLQAKHYSKTAKAKYHVEIDEWLKQLPFQDNWIEKYLYWVRDCNYALPMLYNYGITTSGKSFLAELIGSLFSSEPVKDFFKVKDFQGSAGDSPIIFMDEQIRTDANTLKEMITSKYTVVNLKRESKITVHGYHRFITTYNHSEISLPLKENDDRDALLRRVQPAKFKEKHQKAMQAIQEGVTISWIKDNLFLEHVEWICEKHKGLEPEDSLFALKTYMTPEMLGGGANITDDLDGVIVDFVLKKLTPMIKKETNKTLSINVQEVKNELNNLKFYEVLKKPQKYLEHKICMIFTNHIDRTRCYSENEVRICRIPTEILINEINLRK